MRRSLLVGCIALALLSGCGSSSNGSSRGSAAPSSTGPATGTGGTGNIGFSGGSARSGTDDLVVATPSSDVVSVVIGARRTLSITFASSDARPMSGFAISGTLGTLPDGWTGPSSFSCASVDTGSGCVLNLTYAPVAVGGGTLTVNYVVVDNASMPRTDGSLTIAYAATAHDNIVATASPSGQIDAVAATGSSSVSVNFTTDDGNAATQLALTTDLAALPPGWTSTSPSFTCAIVSTGNGCQLALTYAPMTAGGGTLALNFGYTDDSGAAKTGTLNIRYFTTSPNNVIATASPAGQIIAVQKTGGQAVPVTFTTDDGKPATQLYVISNLTALPAGWSSAASNFSCGSVSTGNGCQLPLTYAPPALASGTLALAYAYTDGTGMAQTGMLNIEYAATTNDNVVGTASPAGQINAVVGLGTQAVAVTFTTDDGRPATALRLTSSLTALPAGWSSSASSFGCSGINVDGLCQLPLTYAPTAAIGSGTLSLSFSYKNNAGEPKTGTVNIAYRATTDDNVIWTPNPSLLAARTGGSTNVTVAFTTDDGNPASALSVTSALTSLPAGWSSASNSFSCTSVSGTGCVLSLTYAPTVAASGTLSLGFSYANDSGFLKTGTVSIAYNAITPYLYVVNGNSNTLSSCAIHFDNSLAACTGAGSGFDGPDGIALKGSYAYVTNTVGGSVSRCTLDIGGAVSSCALTGGIFGSPANIATNPLGAFAYIYQSTGLTVCATAPADGSLSGCTAASAPFDPLSASAFSSDGTHAYGVHSIANPGNPANPTTLVDVCDIAMNGTLTSCTDMVASTPQAVAALAIQNNDLYVSTSAGSLYMCPININWTISSCQTTAIGTNANSLAFIGTTAYLSTNSNTVLACPVNADGTFGTCTALNDPTFNGTAGMVVR